MTVKYSIFNHSLTSCQDTLLPRCSSGSPDESTSATKHSVSVFCLFPNKGTTLSRLIWPFSTLCLYAPFGLHQSTEPRQETTRRQVCKRGSSSNKAKTLATVKELCYTKGYQGNNSFPAFCHCTVKAMTIKILSFFFFFYNSKQPVPSMLSYRSDDTLARE